MKRPLPRLCLITPTHVAVYEGRKQVAVFERPVDLPRDLVEAIRVELYAPMP